ncbi:MAG: TolC family protein [Muribaculum sp.]|nr:TolC family protein [Muribaculum sp.]
MKRKLAFLAVMTVLANDASAQVWSFDDCLNYAREHNISLKQSELNEQTSEYSLEESKAEWQPSLDFSTTHGLTNTPWSEGKKNAYNSNYGLSAAWTVWNGGKRENNIKRAKIQTSINALSTLDLFRNIETELLSIYINVLYNKESIAIYEEAVKLSEAQAERARQLMEAGRLSRVDYAQLQSQYEQDKYNLVNARGTYDNRRMELKRLLELGIDSDITVKDIDWTAEEVLATAPPIDQSYEMALAVDAQLQSAKLQKDIADIDVAIAKSDRYPTIGLNAGVSTGYYSEGPGFGTQMKQGFNENIGLTISVPIFDKKKTKIATAKANIQRINAELDEQSRRNDIAQNVESWYIDLQASQARYEAGTEKVASTSLSNDLVNEQFNLGLVNTVELMTAHNNLLEARHSLLQAKYMAMLGHKMIEYYRTANITMP